MGGGAALAAEAQPGFPSGPEAQAIHRHGIAMHGEPALSPDFTHLPYVHPAAPKGGALRLGIAGSFDSLNTLVVKGNAPPALVPYIVQPLMTRSLDEPFTLYGLLAESVAVPPDRHFVEFRLRQEARFSDGVPVRAKDVLFSWNLFVAKGRPQYRANAARIADIAILDERTLRFTFKSSEDRELPLILGLMPVLPEHATDVASFENMGFRPFIGSGPYALHSLDPGASLTLRRREDYWGKDLPIQRGLYNFDTITMDFFRDSNTMFEAFKTGLLDLRFENEAAKWLKGYDIPPARDGRLIRESLPIRAPKGMTGFIFNTRRPVFADPRLREAMLSLFDFEWLNANLFSNVYRRTGSYFAESPLSFAGEPVSAKERALLGEALASLPEAIRDGSWTPPVTDGSGRDRQVLRRAVELLAKAGYGIENGVMVQRATQSPLSFEILVTSREKERLSLAFADILKQVGIFPRIRLVDSSQYWARLRQFDYDMILEGFPVSASPGQEQRNRWSSRAAANEGTLNWAGVRSPAIDRVLDALLAARETEDYRAAARALDRLLIAGHYVLPLYHLSDRWLARWQQIGRPERLPQFDLSLDTFWHIPSR